MLKNKKLEASEYTTDKCISKVHDRGHMMFNKKIRSFSAF